MAARPQTPASPKNVNVNSPVPGTAMFGCGTVLPTPMPMPIICAC